MTTRKRATKKPPTTDGSNLGRLPSSVIHALIRSEDILKVELDEVVDGSSLSISSGFDSVIHLVGDIERNAVQLRLTIFGKILLFSSVIAVTPFIYDSNSIAEVMYIVNTQDVQKVMFWLCTH